MKGPRRGVSGLATLGAAVCVLTLLAALRPIQTQTVPSVLVLAQSIDDTVSLNPAEVFKLTTLEFSNNLYQPVVRADRLDATEIRPALAPRWEAGADGKSLTFALGRGANSPATTTRDRKM